MAPTPPTRNASPHSAKSAIRSRQRFSYKDKAQVLGWMQQHNASFTDTCNRFGLPESTIRKWNMKKTTIMDMASTMKGSSKSIHKSSVPSLESMVVGWIQERMETKSDEGISRSIIKLWLTQGKDHLLNNSVSLEVEERTALETLKINPHFIQKFMSRNHLLDSACNSDPGNNSSHIKDLATMPDEAPKWPPPPLAPSKWDEQILRIEQQWGVTKPGGNRMQRIAYLERLVFGKLCESKTMAERLNALE